VDEINGMEEEISKLSDEQLREKTEEFRKKLGVDLESTKRDIFKSIHSRKYYS